MSEAPKQHHCISIFYPDHHEIQAFEDDISVQSEFDQQSLRYRNTSFLYVVNWPLCNWLYLSNLCRPLKVDTLLILDLDKLTALRLISTCLLWRTGKQLICQTLYLLNSGITKTNSHRNILKLHFKSDFFNKALQIKKNSNNY